MIVGDGEAISGEVLRVELEVSGSSSVACRALHTGEDAPAVGKVPRIVYRAGESPRRPRRVSPCPSCCISADELKSNPPESPS